MEDGISRIEIDLLRKYEVKQTGKEILRRGMSLALKNSSFDYTIY